MAVLKKLSVFTGLLALLLVTACGGDATATPSSIFPTATAIPTATTAPTATKPPDPSGPLLRVNLGGEPGTLDPHLASSLLEFSVLRQLSEGLLGFDKNLQLTPQVASVVPTVGNGGISADGLTYTFKLRDGLIWSDGQPLTAEDFEFSFKRILSPDLSAPEFAKSWARRRRALLLAGRGGYDSTARALAALERNRNDKRTGRADVVQDLRAKALLLSRIKIIN